MRRFAVTTMCAGLLLLRLAPTATIAAADESNPIRRVLTLTNTERLKAGLKPLVLSDQLSQAAQTYSQVLATSGCFGHTCGPTPKFEERAGQAGYTGWNALGENVGAGSPTPEAVVAAWMSSPSHRANMLSPNFSEIGIGLVIGGGSYGTYWTQEFGARPDDLEQRVAQLAPAVPAEEPAPPEDTTEN